MKKITEVDCKVLKNIEIYLKAFSQLDMKRFDYELNCKQLTVPKSKSERGNCCSDTDIYSTLEDQSLFEV